MGPTRGEDRCCHIGAKATIENNEYYGVLEGNSRNEDSADRVEDNADK
jgi:hypothetical protein